METAIRWIMVASVCVCVACPAFAGSEFNYQGQVSVDGAPFNGTGQFKLAILNEAKTDTLWSNDGTSVNAGEPTAGLATTVTSGIFNIIVGDKSQMGVIPAHIFNSGQEIYLRVWFSDGAHGFEALQPDRRITNVDLLGQTSGEIDFTIYVNGATGDDKNSGLRPNRAKKTIQAGVNMVPGRVRANCTVRIANGTYRESVRIYGISVSPDKALSIVGDESWGPTTATIPGGVRITGTDNDTTHESVREYGIEAEQCSRLRIVGIQSDYASQAGMLLIQCSSVEVRDCKAAFCGGASRGRFGPTAGIKFYQSNGDITRSVGEDNPIHGLYVGDTSVANMTDCIARRNGNNGIVSHAGSVLSLIGSYEASDNIQIGLCGMHNSVIHYAPGSHGLIRNSQSGLALVWESYTEGVANCTYSGNGQNNRVQYGSAVY